MNYKELYLETKEMLEEFDFIDDSKIAVLTYCKNVDDLKLVHDFIMDKKYKNIYDIPKYAFYLNMKRNHPERIIEDKKSQRNKISGFDLMKSLPNCLPEMRT